MDEQKQKLIERIHQAQNILVTVSTNPTVDQLSAAIGLTLALNKLNKHGTAVFSGHVPSTIEFLKPEETLEKNTDSLRDFIIALDKSKADKLRYKVEDRVVRIFITPYKTSLSERDLEFSQGDFNVDVVVALGVTEQQDLDAAITAHGRILHDASVASVSMAVQGSLGTINWVDPASSSLSEMMVSLVEGLDKKILDNQIATALLTGIVANTERFSNEKTTPKTMSASATLMTAGANQQLIATELETPPPLPPEQPVVERQDVSIESDVPSKPHKSDPGTLEINHEADEMPTSETSSEPEEPQIQVDEDGQLLVEPEESLPQISQVRGVASDGQATEAERTQVRRERMTEPPKLGDVDLTANITAEELDPSTEELTLPAVQAPLLSHNENVLQPPIEPPEPSQPQNQYIPQAPLQPAPQQWQPPTPQVSPAPISPPTFVPPTPPPDPITSSVPSMPAQADMAGVASNGTLADIEKSIDSPHVHIDEQGNLSSLSGSNPVMGGSVDEARNAVQAALNTPAAPTDPLQPIAALNANPLGPELHPAPAVAPAPTVPNTGFSEPTPGSTPADSTLDMPLPSNPFGPGQQQPVQPAFQPPTNMFPGGTSQSMAPATPPPPVPPPMLPPLQ